MSKKATTSARRASIKPVLSCIADSRTIYHEGLYLAGVAYYRGVEEVAGTFRKLAADMLSQFVGKARTNELELARTAAENSLMFSYLVTRPAFAKAPDDAARLARVLELNQLKNWRKDCNGDDKFRSPEQQKIWDAWRTAKKEVLALAGLETLETRGGARDNAGRKGTKEGDASKLVTSAPTPAPTDKGTPAPTDKGTPAPTDKGTPASAGTSGTSPDTLTTGTLANYVTRIHDDMARVLHSIDKSNPDCSAQLVTRMKDKEIHECLTRLDQEFARLANLLTK